MTEAVHPDCPACGGLRVEVSVRTGMDQQSVKLWRWTRWGSQAVATARALACAGCGLVTFQVDDLARFQAEVADHPERFRWDL